MIYMHPITLLSINCTSYYSRWGGYTKTDKIPAFIGSYILEAADNRF